MLPASRWGPGHPGALRPRPDEARTVAPNAFLACSPCNTCHAQGAGRPRPDKALVAKPRKWTLCPEPPGRPLPHLALHWRQDATRKQSPPRRGREAARNPSVRRASSPGAGVQVTLRRLPPMLRSSLKASGRKSSAAAPHPHRRPTSVRRGRVLCTSVSCADTPFPPKREFPAAQHRLVSPRNGFSYFECFPPALWEPLIFHNSGCVYPRADLTAPATAEGLQGARWH